MKKYLNIVVLVFMVTSLSSCLKNKYDALNPDNSPSVVEFKNPGPISSFSPQGAPYSMYTKAFVAAPSIDVSYTVQLSGANPAKNDVTIMLGTDPTAVNTFNTTWLPATATKFTELPANLFSLPQTTYIIPAGKRSVDVVVNYKVSQFDYSKKYALPLAIKSTSFGNVSGNFGTILLNIVAKNPYEGIYSYDGTITRFLNGVPESSAYGGSFTGAAPRSITSIDANSAYIVPLWANGAGITGIDNTYLTVDPVTNLVTMACATNATLKNTAGAVNKYDPATKTFTLAFEWFGGTNKRVTTMTLKYTGPTP